MVRKPCRYKACGGVTHRGPCPTAANIGRKGGKQSTPNSADNFKQFRTQVTNLNLCGFCFGPADLCSTRCAAASNAGASTKTNRNIRQSGIKAAAAAAAAQADRLRAMQLIQSVPVHPVTALGSMMLTCIKCNSTKPAIQFNVAFAASDRFNLGDGLCCVDVNSVIED